ncbi:DUF6249 domain-containing protein [uncultured Aquimarina sp.]|uniref:DUF6249 domain-containing protein n=1 Tax=uncultured Aquimarina sp. TaxID=575652 RepID=UPI00260EA478|nr:DUF6249 domain-containing protein [uncultured Aquimarina sp.]
MVTFWQIPFMVSIITCAVVLAYYLKNQHKEKIELIKKGESIVFQDALEQMRLNSLSRGIIAIALALGVVSGYLLVHYTVIIPIVGYLTMLFLSFGIGSLIFYRVIKND